MYFNIMKYLFFGIIGGFSGSVIWMATSELITKRKIYYVNSPFSLNIPIKYYYNYGLLFGLCLGLVRAYLGKSILECVIQ